MDELTGPWDAIEASKAALRRQARRARAGLDAAYRATADASIVDRLVQHVGDTGARRVAIYAALMGEVDLDDVVATLRAQGVVVAYPRVLDATGMRFHRVESPPTQARGTPAIREPAATAPPVRPDLVVLPGLAFDRQGGRLGQGGGYYDRWLAEHPGTATVGVCHTRMLVERVPTLPHDVRVDAVLSEDGVYR